LAFHLQWYVGVVYTHNILNVFNTARGSRHGTNDPWLDAGPPKPRLWRRIAVRMPGRNLWDLDARTDHDSGRTGPKLRWRSSPGQRHPL